MLIKDIMNKNVITTEPETSVREAIRTMVDNHIGSVVVVKNNKTVGIMTERDVLRELATDKYRDVDQLKVGDIMTRWIIAIEPDNTVEKAINLMVKNKIKKLPVIKNDKLVGIITSSDMAVLQPKIIQKLSSLILSQIRYKK
jgi:CBS domain-containing protein